MTNVIAGWRHRYHAQFRLAVRMTLAAAVAYAVGELLALEQSYWAVLTAIIVMQASVGASLKAMLDRLVGSLGGAVTGVAISVGLHRVGIVSPAAELAIGLPPLTLVASLYPAFRVAPITFIILLLAPDLQALGPVQSAIHRMFEIGVGSIIALAVSVFVLPGRAHDVLAQAASQALSAMGTLITTFPGGLTGHADQEAVNAAHTRIRSAIAKAENAAEEALRERTSHLTEAPDPLPVCRTLRRLRHDLAIIGRTTTTALPDAVSETLTLPVHDVLKAVGALFNASADALSSRGAMPGLAEVDAAFAAHSNAISHVRAQGLSKSLPDEDLSRIFGLGFAFEQLRRDLQDIVDRGAELSNRTSSHR
jgi:uncharacterized membrane protein YccC